MRRRSNTDGGPLSAVLLRGLIVLACCRCLSSTTAAKELAVHSFVETASPSSKRSYDLPPFSMASDMPLSSEHEPESFFDNSTLTNVTAQLGTTVYLRCVVRHLGERTVSWIRRRDFHILTVGFHAYSSDQRFQIIHMDKTDDWTLQIKYAQKRDEGLYECQVSSDPPVSQFVTLNVVVGKAEIIGAPDFHANSGTTLIIMCLISQSPKPPDYVFWYHNDRMINYDSERGGISVVTENGETTVSTLTIRHALPADSGNYTCDPSTAEPTSITVHVLNGEKPAAMQHDGKASGAARLSVVTLGLLGAYSTLYFGLR